MAARSITDYIRSASVTAYMRAASLLDADVGNIELNEHEPRKIVEPKEVPGLPVPVTQIREVEPPPSSLWEQRDKALALLRVRAVEMTEKIVEEANKAVAERQAEARNFNGWPSFLSENAIRGFQELSDRLERRFGPHSPFGAGRTLPFWRTHQAEINEFTQNLIGARSETAAIAVEAGKMIENKLKHQQSAGQHDPTLLQPVPDERAVDGMRYARTVPLPRSPWEGIRHPKTQNIDVSLSVDLQRTWFRIGYPDLGDVQLASKPRNDSPLFHEARRKELHDIYEQTGVMVLDGVNSDWVHEEWMRCETYGKHAAAEFIEFANDHPEHLLVAAHLKESRGYEQRLRDIVNSALRESDLAYNKAVSKLRSQWLKSKKTSAILPAAWDLMRRAMRDVAEGVGEAYGRVVLDVMRLEHPKPGLVFVDRKQDGTRKVRREKPVGKKAWLDNAGYKLLGLLTAFGESGNIKPGPINSPVDLVATLGSAFVRGEHDSAGLDEMPGWDQESAEIKRKISDEYKREIGRCRSLCQAHLREACDLALAARDGHPYQKPAHKRTRHADKKLKEPAPDYANNPKYTSLAAGSVNFNIPKSNLSKWAKKEPGSPGYLRPFRDGKRLYFLTSDLQKLARSRPSGRT